MGNLQGLIVSGDLGIPGPIVVVDDVSHNMRYQYSAYTLVAIVQEIKREKVRDEIVHDASTGAGKHVVEWADATKTKYVMRLDEASALAQMKSDLDSVVHEKNGAVRFQATAKEEIAKYSSKAAKLQDRSEKLSAQLKQIQTELRSTQSRNQVMERDLARLRQSLGEIRMKEILAAQS